MLSGTPALNCSEIGESENVVIERCESDVMSDFDVIEWGVASENGVFDKGEQGTKMNVKMIGVIDSTSLTLTELLWI